MSEKKKEEVRMSKRKFYVLLGGLFAVTIPLYGIVSQGIERLFGL